MNLPKKIHEMLPRNICLQKYILLAIILIVFLLCTLRNEQLTLRSEMYTIGKKLEVHDMRSSNDLLESHIRKSFDNPPTAQSINKAPINLIQYRKLMKKIISNDETFTPEEVSQLPTDFLKSEHLTVISNRMKLLHEVCKNEDEKKFPDMQFRPGLLLDYKHHIAICQNPKAASSSITVYSNALTLYNMIDDRLSELSKQAIRFNLKSFDGKIETRKKHNHKATMNLIVVRHPFRRIVSAYVDKVVNTNNWAKDNPEMFRKMQVYSNSSNEEVKKYLQDKTLPESKKGPIVRMPYRKLICKDRILHYDAELANYSTISNDLGEESPSFRGFIIGAIIELQNCGGIKRCLLFHQVDEHLTPQVLRCPPCSPTLDSLLKVETMVDDIKFVEEVLNLPPAWELGQMIIKSNKKEPIINITNDDVAAAHPSVSDFTYEEYMSQLDDEELEMLYNVYQHDFILLGYDPCEGL